MTSDNTFGTAREDALRRDFTINGLFYDISDFSVIDYVGGLEDLEAGLIRTIGDPDDPLPRGPRPDDAGGRVRQPARIRDHARRVRGDPQPPQGDRQVRSAPRHRGARPVPAGRPRPADLPAAARGRPPRRAPSGARRGAAARSTRSTRTARATSSGRSSTSSTPSAGAAAPSTTPSSSPCCSFRSCARRAARPRSGRGPRAGIGSRRSSRTS